MARREMERLWWLIEQQGLLTGLCAFGLGLEIWGSEDLWANRRDRT